MLNALGLNIIYYSSRGLQKHLYEVPAQKTRSCATSRSRLQRIVISTFRTTCWTLCLNKLLEVFAAVLVAAHWFGFGKTEHVGSYFIGESPILSISPKLPVLKASSYKDIHNARLWAEAERLQAFGYW